MQKTRQRRLQEKKSTSLQNTLREYGAKGLAFVRMALMMNRLVHLQNSWDEGELDAIIEIKYGAQKGDVATYRCR